MRVWLGTSTEDCTVEVFKTKPEDFWDSGRPSSFFTMMKKASINIHGYWPSVGVEVNREDIEEMLEGSGKTLPVHGTNELVEVEISMQ